MLVFLGGGVCLFLTFKNFFKLTCDSSGVGGQISFRKLFLNVWYIFIVIISNIY